MRSTSGLQSAQCSPTVHLLWQFALGTFTRAARTSEASRVSSGSPSSPSYHVSSLLWTRRGAPQSAAYDLHFQEQFLQQKHELLGRGFLTVEYLGKREQLPASTKGSQISPRYTEVVVKQLDPRWARRGVTTALLKAAGYNADVAVKTEFAGDLPAHLSCWSNDVGVADA